MKNVEFETVYFLEEKAVYLTFREIANYGFKYALNQGYNIDFEDVVAELSKKKGFDSLSDIEDCIDGSFEHTAIFVPEKEDEDDYEFVPEEELEYEFIQRKEKEEEEEEEYELFF